MSALSLVFILEVPFEKQVVRLVSPLPAFAKVLALVDRVSSRQARSLELLLLEQFWSLEELEA